MHWKTVKVKLKDLQPWERNPRQITKKAAKRLLESFKRYGQVQTIAIGPDLEVYDGHQRLSVLRGAYGDDYEVIALQSDGPLSEEERENLTLLLHAGAYGGWNWDELANWDVEKLVDGGLDEDFLEALNRDVAALSQLLETDSLEDVDVEGIESKYIAKIVSPVYEPSGDQVNLEDIYSTDEYEKLIEEIENANVSEEFKEFARLAAARFVRFKFDKVADYYAMATEEEQKLMEALALVIIDFSDAIDRGFVQISKTLLNLVQGIEKEEEDEDEF